LQKREIYNYLHSVRNAYPPASEIYIKARIATLLSHYFQATTNSDINQMVGTDWIDCLAVFPNECIKEAVNWWRDNETKKPTPANIRKLAIKSFGIIEWERIERLKECYKLPIVDSENELKENEVIIRTAQTKRRVSRLTKLAMKPKQNWTNWEHKFFRVMGARCKNQ